jgi:solute carrier family 25 S-adenosylmethionine transporter 26
MHPNVFEAFRSVVTAEGIGGLYKGFWPTLLRDVPEIAIQFGVYEKLRGVVQAKRNVTKLTYVSYIFTLSSVSLGLCGSVSK